MIDCAYLGCHPKDDKRVNPGDSVADFVRRSFPKCAPQESTMDQTQFYGTCIHGLGTAACPKCAAIGVKPLCAPATQADLPLRLKDYATYGGLPSDAACDLIYEGALEIERLRAALGAKPAPDSGNTITGEPVFGKLNGRGAIVAIRVKGVDELFQRGAKPAEVSDEQVQAFLNESGIDAPWMKIKRGLTAALGARQ